MVYRIRHSLIILALVAVLVPTGAVATTPDTSIVVDREALIQKQMMTLLQEDETRQERAIQLIAHYAHTDRYDASFFRPLVSPLLEVAVDGEGDELRIMAISALSSIGTPSAMNGLEAQVETIESERVQSTARHALVQYEIDQAVADRKTFTDRVMQGQW